MRFLFAFSFFFGLFLLHSQDSIYTTSRPLKKTFDYKSDKYEYQSASFGYVLVDNGIRIQNYDTLEEFVVKLKNGDMKFVAVTTRGIVAMAGKMKQVMIGRMHKTHQKTGTWKYYNSYGKLILKRKEKIKKPHLKKNGY